MPPHRPMRPKTDAVAAPVASDADPNGPRHLVAVVGDVRLLCESIALLLRTASIPATVIDPDALGQAPIGADAVVLVVRNDGILDDMLWRVERSLPGLPVVLVASCCPRANPARDRHWSARLEFGTSVDSLVHTVDRLLKG